MTESFLTRNEQRLLRGYLLYIIRSKYPHHISRELLDESLKTMQQWHGDRETLTEIVYMRDLGFLTWEKKPNPHKVGDYVYSYVLTPEGRTIADGYAIHPDVALFKD